MTRRLYLDSEKSRWRRPLIWAAAVGLSLLALYVASPWWAARSLRQAFLSGDAYTLEEMIDFPSVRADLKSQMTSALTQRMQNDPELRNNPFAALGLVMVPQIVNTMVDGHVTPQGLTRLITRETGSGEEQKGPTNYNMRYRDLNRFELAGPKSSPERERIRFIMRREGFFAWKVDRVSLPMDRLRTESGESGPAAGQTR